VRTEYSYSLKPAKRTLVNHLLEGLAHIEAGKVQDFNEAMKEIRKEFEI